MIEEKPVVVLRRGKKRWILQSEYGFVSRFYGKNLAPYTFDSAAKARAYLLRNFHPSTKLRFEGKWVAIDRKIVPLIKATWAIGLRTELSCQNQSPPNPYEGGKLSGRWMMVKLPSRDAIRWLSIVRPTEKELLHPSQWAFSAYPNFGPTIDFPIFIYFRWSLIPRVLASLRSA